jgi:hypothetical protein
MKPLKKVSAVRPIFYALNEARADRVLVHVDTRLVVIFVRTNPMVKRRKPASDNPGSLRSARPQISKPRPNHRMAKAFLPAPRKSVHDLALSDTN